MREYLGSHALVSEETTARIMKYCNFNVKNKSNECNSAIEEDYVKVKPYLNNPEVQKALHANVINIPYAWPPCSDVIAKWNDSPTTVIPLLKEFLASGLRVWIFSGDMDSIIPVTSTQKSIQLLNLPIKTPWHPWFSYGEINGKKQTDALSHLYMNKLRGNSVIDRSYFNTTTSAYFLSPKIHPQGQAGTRENDRIVRLPGQPPVRFKQYGGYVTVDQTAGRAFYYYFVEAQHSQSSLPLLLWLNGGPGCSSLGYGAMEELGPFRVQNDGETLNQNQFSWNNAANVLFLESPAGVGFSYSNTTSDFTTGGDVRTAIDNYAFLINWLERFPEYKNRDFYISGESYGGHYVPQLAHTILYHNKANKSTTINLKGIIIGNAVINDETDEKGMYEYWGSHALISDENLGQILNLCDFSATSKGVSNQCVAALLEAQANTAALNIYNIYAPTCTVNSTFNYTFYAMSVDPCIDDYVHEYLNRADVQMALHANLTKIPYDWEGCSEVIKTWKDSPPTVIPLLKNLIANDLRVWIYSGDVDGRVPVTSTKLSIQLMDLNPITPWLPWYLDGQVGGYTQVYEGGVTFATVRGAGHEVPMYQPAAALSLINHFLTGNRLPTSRNASTS